MKMIRWSLLVILLVIGSNMYSQKQTVDPSTYSARMTDWMKTNLHLTDQQLPAVQEINLKYANKLKDLQTSSSAKKQKIQTLKANEDAKDAELKNVFTPEQYKSYLSKKEEMKKMYKEKRNGG